MKKLVKHVMHGITIHKCVDLPIWCLNYFFNMQHGVSGIS